MIPEWVKVKGKTNNASTFVIKVSEIICIDLITSSSTNEVTRVVVHGVGLGAENCFELDKSRYDISDLLKLYDYFESKSSFEPIVKAPVSRPAFAE